MKKWIALGGLLIGVLFASAQTIDKPKSNRTNHFFSLHSTLGVGYQYKHQCGEKLWWRGGINLHQVSFQQSFSSFSSNQMLVVSTGIVTGLEWRKPINESLIFLHGPELGVSNQSYFFLNSPGNRPLHYLGMGVAYQFGVMAQLTPHLGISGELTPGITYTKVLNPFESADQLSLGSTTGLGKISLVIIP